MQSKNQMQKKQKTNAKRAKTKHKEMQKE